MQVSERRKKILEILDKKGSLSYKEILDETCTLGDPIDILSDLDILASSEFLQSIRDDKKPKLTPETVLELRPKTEKQMKDDPLRINSQLKELEHEFPSWYSEWNILSVLENQKMGFEEILNAVNNRFPHMGWPLSLIEASLKTLKKYFYISATGKNGSERYTLSSKGKELFERSPFDRFLCLGKFKDGFAFEFRRSEDLNLVINYEKLDQSRSSKKITRYIKPEYKRSAKRNETRYAHEDLIKVPEINKIGNVYLDYLGRYVKLSPMTMNEIMRMSDCHNIQEFKETIAQFLEEYKISGVKRDDKLRIELILHDLEQRKQGLSLRSPEEWIDHIMFLMHHFQNVKSKGWEGGIYRCIIACTLSHLLPPDISVKILLDYSPPLAPSSEQNHYYSIIAREYYFNLTEAYLSLEEDEEAFQTFEILESLSQEFPGFLIIKGIIEMKKGNMREAIDIFEKTLEMLQRKEKIIPLFQAGLTNYQRGDFKEAKKAWEKCLNLGCTIDEEIILRHNLANIYRMSGKLEEARKFYKDCIVFAGRFPEKGEFRVRSSFGLAKVFIDLCLWEAAEKELRQTIHECTEKEFLQVAAIAKTNLGVLSYRMGRYDEALACHAEALNLVDKKHNSQEYSIILSNLGDTFRKLKRMSEAMAALKEALELSGSGNMTEIQSIEVSLADLFVDIGNLDEGWKLSHSVLMERWLDNRRSEAEARRIQGKILLRKNEFQEAKKSLKESEEILGELNLKYELLEVFELLEACCKSLKNEMEEAHYRDMREVLTQRIEFPIMNSYSE
ncbi:MAG: hypothetical protein AYK18_14335 [Theionarchaea archaeon DG-70]|nr:MAG: hypothetical protein AYK18_14335 [Theionarchaea archaeon DG-70]